MGQNGEHIPGVTIFTPTYNRAHTLFRLYDSLKNQDCSWMEWLIIDDGSTDETKALIHQFILEKKINIQYHYKKNGGKHTALNMGIQLATRRYFCCVDSDDCLAPDAITIIRKFVEEKNPKGVIAYKRNIKTDKLIGKEFPTYLSQSTLFELINSHGCAGDRTLIYQTKLIQSIHIPEPAGMQFFPETYLYDRFDEQYSCDLLREQLCICEYLEDGYSNSFRMLMIRNAVSMKWFYADRIDMKCSFWTRYRSVYRYMAYSCLSKSTEGCYVGKRRSFFLLAAPAALLMYLYYGYYRWKTERGLET